jgi:hypothetical protein
MQIVIALLITLATLENVWPFVAGLQQTPSGFTFLGTVHHPADYFYYLSQFTQGSERLITTIDLFTSEAIAPSLVGWSNVLIGRVFSLVGLSPIVAYHVSVLILTVGVLVSAYYLAQMVLKSKVMATIALYLFALFHAFPLLRDGKPSYGDYWNNIAVPRVRLGAVPHQLLLNLSSITLVYLFLNILEKQRMTKVTGIGIILSSFTLAMLQPVLWVSIIGVLIIALLIQNHLNRFSAKALGLIVATGAAPLLYLSRLFTTLPFSQLKAWESANQPPVTFEHFISASGPILLISLLVLPVFLAKKSLSHFFLTLFSFGSVAIFLTPVPKMLGFSSVRFMSTLMILGFSIIAAYGLSITLARWKWALVAVLAALTIYLFPNHLHMIALYSSFDPKNSFQYLSVSDTNFLIATKRHALSSDTFLVIWPYNLVFPALSGRKSFHGHPLLTISADKKEKLAQTFFDGTMPEAEIATFLAKGNISYIITAPWKPLTFTSPQLTKIDSTDTLELYRVSK